MADPKLKPGSRACRCACCGEYFGGERAFDVHRVGPMTDRRCLPRSGMRDVGLDLDESGYWRRPKEERPARTGRQREHRDTPRARRDDQYTTSRADTSQHEGARHARR